MTAWSASVWSAAGRAFGRWATSCAQTGQEAPGTSVGRSTAARDLLVVDGPPQCRQHLPRAIGFVKSHRSDYLPTELGLVVAALGPGERTPVFRLAGSWERCTWYLRLPCPPGAPWDGVVRVECRADLTTDDAVALASLSQVTLPR